MAIKYSPYETLGLEPEASEEDAKRQYKQLIREYSPEHEPERFIAIREAYDLFKKGGLESADDHPRYRKPLTWLAQEEFSASKDATQYRELLSHVFETPYNTLVELRNLIRKVRKSW